MRVKIRRSNKSQSVRPFSLLYYILLHFSAENGHFSIGFSICSQRAPLNASRAARFFCANSNPNSSRRGWSVFISKQKPDSTSCLRLICTSQHYFIITKLSLLCWTLLRLFYFLASKIFLSYISARAVPLISIHIKKRNARGFYCLQKYVLYQF